MTTMTAVMIPLGYRKDVRDLHNRCGVTVRETKGLLSSTFYFNKTTHNGSDLFLELKALARRIERHELALAAEEARFEREVARKKLARKNRWRKLTFRKPKSF